MNTTTKIKVGKAEYSVEKTSNGNYLLTGARGAVYMLMRNQNQRELFPVGLRGEVAGALRGCWFSDESGELRRVA